MSRGRIHAMKNDKNIASLESRIGLYWLHKLGIVTLVFGIVFLITYSIQLSSNPLLMPLFKLSIGFAVSIALLFLGKKMSVKEKEKWYGHGLTAGGWSLAYFTTYAAYYIEIRAARKRYVVQKRIYIDLM